MTEDTLSALGASTLDTRPIRIKRLRTESLFLEETKGLERRERDRYGNMIWNLMTFDFAPKVKLVDIVGHKMDNEIDTEHEGPMRSVVDHYHGRANRNELNQVLKFFSVFLIQRARREPNFNKQLFLLFKAVDLLRMLTQYSTWCAHRDAESLVFTIFDELGSQKGERFANYQRTEHRVFPLMKKLHEVPRDFVVRLELADELARQMSFFDAYVQYDFLRRFYPRFYTQQNLERRLGVIYARTAGIFQNMLDHLGRGYRDARKVNSFIERYNRAFAGRKDVLESFSADVKGGPERVARGLRHAAETWYRKALAIKVLSPEIQVQCAMALGRNLGAERRGKEALSVLMDGYRFWSGIGGGADAGRQIEIIQRRIGYLEHVIKIGRASGRKDAINFANLEQRDLLGKLDELVRQNESYKRKREEIVAQMNESDEDGDLPDGVAAMRRGTAAAVAPVRGRRPRPVRRG